MRRIIVEIDDRSLIADPIIDALAFVVSDECDGMGFYVERSDRRIDATTILRVSKNDWTGLRIDNAMIAQKLANSGISLERLLMAADLLPKVGVRE